MVVGVISKYLHQAETAGLGWPLPADLSEQALTKLLQPPRAVFSNSSALAEPDFEQIASELKQKGMTRQLLWEEYSEDFPENHYSYSRFTVLFRHWRQKQQLSMRQTHLAGEKLFVDYLISLSVSLIFYLANRFQISRLLELLPYPVICRFMAGVGWLLLDADVVVALDTSISIDLLSTQQLGDNF